MGSFTCRCNISSVPVTACSIIQRTGVVPMSIAGIAKEVTTITISAWFFGDQLTPLNVTGVSITICGMLDDPETLWSR